MSGLSLTESRHRQSGKSCQGGVPFSFPHILADDQDSVCCITLPARETAATTTSIPRMGSMANNMVQE